MMKPAVCRTCIDRSQLLIPHYPTVRLKRCVVTVRSACMDALAFRPNPQPWGQKQKHTLFASLASSTTRQQKSRETHTTELCILRQLSISYTPARMRVVDRAET